MRLLMAIAVGAAMSACSLCTRAQAKATTAESDVWEQLLAANDLEVKGKTPFDLAMTFQLYDLDGKPTVTGSVEEWWAAPRSKKVVVHLPGLDEDGKAPDGADPALVRDAWLVRQLLEEATAPVPKELNIVPLLQTKNGEVVANATARKGQALTATRRVKLGKVALDCTAPAMGNAMNVTPTTLCVEPQSTDVLLSQGLGGKETVLRPRTGKFHDTNVALELKVDFMDKPAIAGKLTTLKTWDPASSEIKLPVAETAKTEAASLDGGVIQGRRISFVEPQYPTMAKIGHQSGSVLLSAMIAKDGTVERLVPVAITSTMFTDAAMDAVKQWKYSPYLLTGEPTEVNTTITVYFQFN